MGILFKVLANTVYAIFWPSYLVRIGPRENAVDLQKELGLHDQKQTYI